MKKPFKIIGGLMTIFALTLAGCNKTSAPAIENSYTITWKNYDGSVLETDTNVKEGTIPTYDGVAPSRESDFEYTYTWSGWDPDVTPVTGDQTYVATYRREEVKVEYVINFDLNGGESSSYTGSKTVEEFTKDIFFFDCVKEGWNFRGWSYQNTKIFDEKGNQLDNPTMSKSMTFVAIYSQTAKMTITTNLVGAGDIVGEGEYSYNTYIDVSAHPKQGYLFDGWYFEDTLLSNSEDYKFIICDVDVTLEARFKYDSFLINVHTNNDTYGLVLLKSVTNTDYFAQYEEYREHKSDVTVIAYSKSDVRFLGWYDMDNKLVNRNVIYSFKMPNYDYTLEAKWNYFTISYNLYGGTNNPSNPASYTQDSAIIELRKPTKVGYEFLGWQYEGEYITEIDPSLVTNITLNAVWKANTYSISYELNGGTNDSDNPLIYTIETETIRLKDPSRVGYSFSGWYSESTFANEVTEIEEGTYGDIELYAKWTTIDYSITYNLDGGTNNPNNPSTYTIESSFALLAPSKVGYTFIGWFDDNGDEVDQIVPGRIGALTLNAHWNEGNIYLVTFDPKGGETPETFINVQFDHDYVLPTPTRTGYTFAGWYYDLTLVSQSGTWNYAHDVTLGAHWNSISYSISYELYGGTNNPNNPSTYTIESSFALLAPSKVGYTFIGWFDDNGDEVDQIVPGRIGALTLNAHWNEGNTYIVTFVPNGGEVSQNTLNVQYNHDYALPTPTRTGYTFAGWYYDSTLVSQNGTWNYAHDVTLGAHWNPITYSITYNLNGGTIIPGNPNSYTIESDTFVLNGAFKDGYIFDGWYRESTFDNEITQIVQGNYGDMTLYAKWIPENYSINYELNGGTNDSSNPSTYNIESSTISFADPTKYGYNFTGWTAGGSSITSIPTGSMGDVTLTANWELGSYDVNVVINDDSFGSVSGDGTYTFGSNVTLTATPENDYAFGGWYSDSEMTSPLSYSDSYTFTLETEGITIYAKFITEEDAWNIAHGVIPTISIDGKTMTYGLYPQTNVNDSSLISALNALTTPEANGWYLYNGEYYAKAIAANETALPPYLKFDNGTTIVNGETYWFKCEPISWKILSNENGNYYLVSNLLLDSQMFNSSLNDKTIDGTTYHTNDFRASDLRYWLNNSFYNSAFSLNNSAIQYTSIDADIDQLSQNYVYLPSNVDYGNDAYFEDDDSRRCITTDWARANGAYPNNAVDNLNAGWYWARSIYPDPTNELIYLINLSGMIARDIANDPGVSVRPAITIRIN